MEHTLHQALSSIDHEEGQLEQEEQQLQMDMMEMDLDFTLPLDLDFTLPLDLDLDLENLIEVIVLLTYYKITIIDFTYNSQIIFRKWINN